MGRDKAPAPPPADGAKGGKGVADLPPKPVAKGHRQKGAGAIIKDKGPVERGGVEVQSWQRIPSQLIAEHCQREKRPKPMYYSRTAPPGQHLQEIALPDPKDADKTLRYRPSQPSDTHDLAREHAALLALLDVQGTLPLERKLPEPYRTKWLLSQSAVAVLAPVRPPAGIKGTPAKPAPSSSPSSSSPPLPPPPRPTSNVPPAPAPDASQGSSAGPTTASTRSEGLTSVYRHASRKAQQEEDMARRTEQNRKAAQQETKRRSRTEDTAVFMSSRMRRELEAALGLVAAPDEDLLPDDDDEDDLPDTEAVRTLRGLGFLDVHLRHAVAALGEDADRDALIRWLCLLLPEDRLPKRFQASGQTLDLKAANAPPSGPPPDPDASAATTALVCRLRTYGFRLTDCMAAAAAGGDDGADAAAATNDGEADAVGALHRRLTPLVTALRSALRLPTPPAPAALEAPAEGDDTLADERVALASILGEDGALEVQEGPVTLVTMRLDPLHSLDVFVTAQYPAAAPIVLVRRAPPMANGGAYIKLQGSLLTHAAGLVGEPMLYGLYAFAQEAVADVKIIGSGIGEGPLLLTGTGASLGSPTAGDDVEGAAEPPGGPEASGRGPHPRESRDTGWWAPSPASRGSAGPSAAPQRFVSPALKRMLEHRATLPAAQSEKEVISLLQKHPVVLVAGETGCGKTTQIPQFLLSAAERCKVVVAQPRRLAAMGVATRVAQERDERVGLGCGYHVRGDARYGNTTRLLFCTTGIILRMLQRFPRLEGITHVIVDEVHERHLDGDLLMALLRRLLLIGSHLKVILMSATMDTDRLAAYFQVGTLRPPVLHIPGRTFPVEAFGLEAIRRLLGKAPAYDEDSAGEAEGDEPGARSSPEEARIDYALLTRIVDRLCTGALSAPEGAVLVFLPGAGEISRLCEMLRRLPHPLHVLPLHGGLSPSDQQQVFQEAPRGKRKVVVSTNIAETSITIPDVTVVIDTARVKETGYDPLTNVPCLLETWASRASLRQRQGRAGRVQPGVCFRTVSDRTYDKLPAHTIPEVQRTALDQVVLQLKALGEADPSAFLGALLDPPTHDAVNAAIAILREVQALDASGALTPQGWHQAAIPAPVRLSKALLYGALLGVLDPVLTVVAGLTVRSPFLGGANRDTADRCRDRLVRVVGRSDHLVLAQLYAEWEGSGDRRGYCRENGVSNERLLEMREMRRDLGRDVRALGFDRPDPDPSKDTATAHWRLVRAAICLGLYMNVVQVRQVKERHVETLHGAMPVDPEAKAIKFFVRSDHLGKLAVPDHRGDGPAPHVSTERVFLHPASVGFKARRVANWLVFHDISRTAKTFIRDCSEVSPYALLLAARDIHIEPLRNKMLLDGWIWLAAAPRIATLIEALKARVGDLLLQKLEDPTLDINATPEVTALLTVLMTDGMR